MDAIAEKCPECGAPVVPHCPKTNFVCRWKKCSRLTACGATLDVARRRGFIMVGSTARQVRWTA